MAKLLEAEVIEKVIRKYLELKGCTMSPSKTRGQIGPDIVAKRNNYTWFIEVIGFQEAPPIRSREFYEAFFRVISRDRGKPNNDILVLGLSRRFKAGMKQRMNQYPVAWRKLGEAFPNLCIWYVDHENNKVEECPWSEPFD